MGATTGFITGMMVVLFVIFIWWFFDVTAVICSPAADAENFTANTSFQDTAGFGMERVRKNTPIAESINETFLDTRATIPTGAGMTVGDHHTARSNESESGAMINPNEDWSQAIQDISLEPDIIASHKRYVQGENGYLNTGAAAPNLPIREDDQTINPWVGLTGAIHYNGMVKDGARVVPSENYDQLRQGTQLRWRTGSSS